MPDKIRVAIPYQGFEPIRQDYETGVVVMQCTACGHQITTTLTNIEAGSSGIEAHNRDKPGH